MEAAGHVVQTTQFDVQGGRVEWGGLVDWNMTTDTIVLKLGPSCFGRYLVDLSTRQETIGMVRVKEDEVERSGAPEIGHWHAGIGVVLLGKHALCEQFNYDVI